MIAVEHAILLITIVLSNYAVVIDCFGMTKLSSISTKRPFADSTTSLHAAGIGMAVAPKKKKGKKGTKKSPSTPFDANASLVRLEKKYEELSLANAKAIQQDDDDVVTSEYIIAARAIGTLVSDWVPVAQMCIARPLADAEASEGVADISLRAVVSHYCREIFEAATLGAPVFRSLPRNNIQYSVESFDSFHKHVYESVIDGSSNSDKAEDQIMTKSQARTVLKLDGDTNDAAVIKKAYRSLSFELHPDRLVGQSEEQVQSASNEYARIKLAFDTLSSGVRTSDGVSWYASLGGRARTEFVGPLTLMSLGDAKAFLSSRTQLNSAVVGLDPEMVQTFVVRNQAASSS